MHQVNDAIVKNGKITLTELPFADGQHVRVTIDEVLAEPEKKRTIEEVRELLRGSVIKFDNPTDPMIPEEDWEMLR